MSRHILQHSINIEKIIAGMLITEIALLSTSYMMILPVFAWEFAKDVKAVINPVHIVTDTPNIKMALVVDSIFIVLFHFQV